MRETIASRLRAWAEKDGRGYPDWATRYLPIVRRLRRHGIGGRRILEIGANENGLARFAGVRVVATDINVDHLRAARAAQDVLPVVADISALPFRDGAFGVVVSVDTLEHIPRPRRLVAVGEAVRVLDARGVAAVAFPTGPQAVAAERAVTRAYADFTGRSLHWLAEHAEQGLPDAETMRRAFTDAAGKGRRVTVTKNTNVRAWRWMWKVLMCGWPGRGNAIFQALLRAVTPLLAQLHAGRCYRAVVWIEPRP